MWDRASSENNHLPDKYKKPNHPTFSTESIYAKGEYAQHAGTWTQKQSGDWMYNPSKTRLEAVRKVAKF